MRLAVVFELLLILLIIAFAASNVIRDPSTLNRARLLKKVEKNAKRTKDTGATNSPTKYCNCSSSMCNCCRDFNIPVVSAKGPGCATISFLKDNEFGISMKYGDRILRNITITVGVNKSLQQDEVDLPSENNELTPANKPTQQNTQKPQTSVPIIVQTTTPAQPLIRYPCSCGAGQCGCCTGNVLPIGQIACTNVTYDPDEFRFHLKMYFNERIVYQTSMSGQNPRPVCVPIRALNFKFCARMHNVYMVGRNVHACLSVDGQWRSTELFNYHFDCFRIGNSGVAFVKPEDGGGLPPPPEEDVLKPGEEDYDDTARHI